MKNQQNLQVIEIIKNMSDEEADILEVFIAGFRAGKQTTKNEFESKD